MATGLGKKMTVSGKMMILGSKGFPEKTKNLNKRKRKAPLNKSVVARIRLYKLNLRAGWLREI